MIYMRVQSNMIMFAFYQVALIGGIVLILSMTTLDTSGWTVS
jgi:hypothetical protein